MLPTITNPPQSVRNVCNASKVWLSEVVALSDGSFWLPNCGGDLNGGGQRISTQGEYSFWAYSDEEGYPLQQFAASGIFPVAKGL